MNVKRDAAQKAYNKALKDTNQCIDQVDALYSGGKMSEEKAMKLIGHMEAVLDEARANLIKLEAAYPTKAEAKRNDKKMRAQALGLY